MSVPDYISKIRESDDVDEQVRLLGELNSRLPKRSRLSLPSLFTRHYISKAVSTIEEVWFDGNSSKSKSARLALN